MRTIIHSIAHTISGNRLKVQNFVFALILSSFFASSAVADSDQSREARINSMIASNEVLDGYSIEADVKDDRATLKGVVALDTQKDLAKAIAASVAGIKKVDNNIEVKKGQVRGESASIAQSVKDATTTAKVKSKLLWNRSLSGTDISVETNNHVLTLGGAVNTAAEKDLAERVALKTSGVHKVNNTITVTNPRARLGGVDLKKVENNAGEALEDVGGDISDAWITTKVQSSLIFTRSLSIDALRVNTNNQVVTISGMVDSKSEKDLVSEIANDIAGVKSVKNEIQVR
jgi:hyperosmotically inducible protein